MSVYSLAIALEYGGNRDAQSRNAKKIYFILLNNKFLGKYWYGRYPWMRLAVECERMMEKRTNFIFSLRTAYDLFSMEDIVNSYSFSLTRKSYHPKNVYLIFFLWALAPLRISAFLCEGPVYLLHATFYFEFESSSSFIKHQLRNTVIIFEHRM